MQKDVEAQMDDDEYSDDDVFSTDKLRYKLRDRARALSTISIPEVDYFKAHARTIHAQKDPLIRLLHSYSGSGATNLFA